METWQISSHDREILRHLAATKAHLSQSSLNLERKRLWHALDEGRAERPMILAESWVAFEELPESQLACQEEWARELERGLRFELFMHDVIQDDHVLEPCFDIRWKVTVSGYGLESETTWAERVSGNVSSRHWKPAITDIDRDFPRLHKREYMVDREQTLAWKACLENLFEGILTVRFHGGYWWTMGLTQTLIDFLGMDGYMLAICENPDGLHQLMQFLYEDHAAFAEWLEQEGLFTLNNENDYIGSGSMGYTRALPQPDALPGAPPRLRDAWVLIESQESVGVSPEQYASFVYPYHLALAERFGRVYYGCCEPVHAIWNTIRHLPNLKRVSISPWCDQAFMAEALGRKYVFSRKVHPSRISTPAWDEAEIRGELAHTLSIARDCNVELIMKDVHTLCGQPGRMARWVQMAREEVDRIAG